MREKVYIKPSLSESDSASNMSRDTRSNKNTRSLKNSSAKKNQVVVKKTLNSVIGYTEMDLDGNTFYSEVLKGLGFGKEKKKPSSKSEKPLHENVCKHHYDVHDSIKANNKNLQIVLGKKVLLYD